jgi:hypothetical protein
MINAANVQEPAEPRKDYPPPGFVARHNVKSGDNWEKLRQLYSRSSVWDLIIFNFNTTVVQEVNWYLGRYVGCTRTTSDKKNYRFRSKDVPGVIYIPSADWKPAQGPVNPHPEADWETTQDLAAKAAALSILKGHDLSVINFVWNHLRFDSYAYGQVARLIEQGRIAVDFDPSQNDQAEYDSDANTLHFGFTSVSSPTKAALVVHEATHAALDMMRANGLAVLESEAIAYLAQCLFYVKKTGCYLDANKASKKASEIAEGILDQNKTLTDEMRSSLVAAVFQTPLYSGVRYLAADYNGIP